MMNTINKILESSRVAYLDGNGDVIIPTTCMLRDGEVVSVRIRKGLENGKYIVDDNDFIYDCENVTFPKVLEGVEIFGIDYRTKGRALYIDNLLETQLASSVTYMANAIQYIITESER